MSLLGITATLAVVYALIHFALLPAMEKRWAASDLAGKIAKATTLATLKSLRSFLQVALITYGALAAFLAVAMIVSPLLSGKLLIWAHGAATKAASLLEPFKGAVGGVLFWGAALGLLYFAVRARRSDMLARLGSEYSTQMEALIAKYEAGDLEALEPSAEMDKAEALLRIVDERRITLDADGPEKHQDELAHLDGVARQIQEDYLRLDLRRRVDLTEVEIDEPEPSGWWPRMRLAVFSKSALETANFSKTVLARAATVLACLAIVGVAAPAAHALAAEPILTRLTALQVRESETLTEQALTERLRTPLPPDAPTTEDLDEEDGGAYRVAAVQFSRALAQSAVWRTGANFSASDLDLPAPARPQDAAEDLVLRQALLEEYVAGSDSRRARLQLASFDAADLDDGAQRRFANYQRRTVGLQGSVGEAPLARVEGALKEAALRSPTIRARLRADAAAYVRGFGQAASLSQYSEVILGELVSGAFDGVAPSPSGAFSGQAADLAKESAESAANRVTRAKFAAFLLDLHNGASLDAALTRVRSPELPFARAIFTRGEARKIGGALQEISADETRFSDIRRDFPASLHRTAPAGDQALADDLVRIVGPGRDAAEVRQRLEGLAGQYDDLFPGQTGSEERSALGKALARANLTPEPPPFSGGGGGGGGGGAGPDRARESAGRSRSYARLSGHARVGGVLIGAEADGGDARFTRLDYRRKGERLELALLTRDGTRHELGVFSPALIQQAMAYAADGRPVAVTMTSGGGLAPMLRVQVHPALIDTSLGCDLVELDRFVDKSTGQDAVRREWNGRVRSQLQLYTLAILAAQSDTSVVDFLAANDIALAPADRTLDQYLSATFPKTWRAEDPRVSIFAAYPRRFSMPLVQRLASCAAQGPADDASYLTCAVAGLSLTEYTPASHQIWSGVRETSYRPEVGAFRAAGRSTQTAAPLRFMDQVAFETELESDGPPWEFPMFGDRIGAQVMANVRRSPGDAAVLQRAREFTALQRLFRSALAGQLGPDFAKGDLLRLMRTARSIEPVAFAPTPDWHVPRAAIAQFAADEAAADLPEGPTAVLRTVLKPESGYQFAEVCRR